MLITKLENAMRVRDVKNEKYKNRYEKTNCYYGLVCVCVKQSDHVWRIDFGFTN